MSASEFNVNWVPEACTLPTADQPPRVAEFNELFATSVRDIERITPSRLRLTLDPSAAARTADLMVRESGCCTFFNFTLTALGDRLQLDIRVPTGQTAVLDAINARACAELSA
jgi:hypothetical protein